jgi:signal transduction histidine kinase
MGAAWRAWWVGDALGALVVTPLVLTVFRAPRARPSLREWVEATVVACALIVTAFIVFFDLVPTVHAVLLRQTYLPFPFLVAAALRFRQRGAALATAGISVVAVAGTVLGHGPFVLATLNQSLVSLQIFTGVVAVTFLLLASAMAQQKAATQLREDFLSVAGHELRTPLALALLQLQGAQRELEKMGSPPSVARAVASIKRLDHLTQQLLDVGHLAAGKLVLEAEPVELRSLIQDVVARVVESAPEPRPDVQVTGSPQVSGRWDRLRLEQVVTNLVTNALKYGQGKPIHIDLQCRDRDVIVRVLDGGMGIAPEKQQRIFERFERAAAPGDAGGWGLGLWIARKIVEDAGGRIRVDSAPGQGACFTVELPLKPTREHRVHAKG